MKSSRLPSIKVNFIMNTVLTMSSFVFPLITFPYITRVLLPEGTGKVAFAIALIQYFTMFAQLGIPTYGVRACAKVRDDREELTRVTHELLIITLTMSVVSYIALAASLIYIPRLHDERTLYIIVSASIFLTAIGMEWLYKALEKYTYIAIRSIVFKIAALIAMFMLVHTKDDYIVYGGIAIFAASASNVVNFINARKYIFWHSVGSYCFKRHFGAIAIFFAMSCATIIYTYVDELMLGFMTASIDVGYYDAAVKIKKVLVSVVTSLGVVILPRASYYVEHNRMDDFWDINKKALNFVFIISVPIMTYFVIFAKEGILLLAGEAYKGAVIPMMIIMPTLLFIGLTNIMGIQILVPLDREKIVLYSVIVGALVDIIVNMILIPKYGAAGAATGTVVAEFVVLIVQFIALKENVKNTFIDFPYIKVIAGILFGGSLSCLIKRIDMNVFFVLILSGVIFFGIYVTVLLVTKEKLTCELLNEIYGKIKRKMSC